MNWTRRAWLCGSVALWLWGATHAAAQQACRQALALALDVSGSVDATEYRLQLDGVAAALDDPDVQQALLSFPQAPVRLMIFEWSGLRHQRRLLDWTVVDSLDEIAKIQSQLRRADKIEVSADFTALAAAMLYGAQALAQHKECWTKTLDVSGDGPGNQGVHPRELSEGQLGDITINGLIIGPNSRANTTKNLLNVKTLKDYYESFVLRGPGAFAEEAQDYADFEQAMRRKLIREIMSPALSALPDPARRIQ